ncbi:ABC transporter ATP-binding protein [Paenibacillus arenilitoris]|uniref:ABC transporter ATP-binding protein n=1 Tax=Paenibacillus arenilitoris TaxID=2772299 RepID=A0A927CGH0_9BACL|nr:ABC transporter ATP-binding protein [Paenibacillus arenilitoris]MBD2867039.1 ABC transporter ATP-binding protein [Paenibacillus arenilitoris]
MKVIDVRNISFQYKGTERPAVEQIRFEVNQGEIVGLLGHNGAGKTTILKCIAGLMQPAAGEITMAPAPGKDAGTNDRTMGISDLGYVPSDFYLYPLLTVEEMIRFTASLHRLEERVVSERMNAMLNAFQLNDKRHQFVKTLSNGMKQKVALITGVIHYPQTLVLDEPMTGYDAVATRETKNFLTRYANEQQAGILLSSHRLDVVEDICERIVVIHQGKAIFNGAISELKHLANDSKTLEEALLRMSTESEEVTE